MWQDFHHQIMRVVTKQNSSWTAWLHRKTGHPGPDHNSIAHGAPCGISAAQQVIFGSPWRFQLGIGASSSASGSDQPRFDQRSKMLQRNTGFHRRWFNFNQQRCRWGLNAKQAIQKLRQETGTTGTDSETPTTRCIFFVQGGTEAPRILGYGHPNYEYSGVD